MAANLKIDSEKLRSFVAGAYKLTNEAVIDACAQLNKALAEDRGENPIMDSAYEALVKFQKAYNENASSLEVVLGNFTSSAEFGDEIAKITADLVTKRETGYTAKKIQPTKVIQ